MYRYKDVSNLIRKSGVRKAPEEIKFNVGKGTF